MRPLFVGLFFFLLFKRNNYITCTIQGESSGRATYAQDTTGGASKGTTHDQLNDRQLEVQECNFINLQPQQTEEDGRGTNCRHSILRYTADEWMDNRRSSFEALSTTLPIRHPLELMSSLLLVCTGEFGRTLHTLKWVRAK